MTTIEEIIQTYDTILKVADTNAMRQSERAPGGVLRALKGALHEQITGEMIKIAWHNLGGSEDRLDVNSKKIPIPICQSYIDGIQDQEIKGHIQQNVKDYFYRLSVDKHISIDGRFVMAIECKAYTENAMLKRVLVDFHLLKSIHQDIICFLFQLESQLGGDYSELPNTALGSYPTHSIMSYFPNVDLQIFTLLAGERKVKKPIHKPEFFKPLKRENVEKGVKLLEHHMERFLQN